MNLLCACFCFVFFLKLFEGQFYKESALLATSSPKVCMLGHLYEYLIIYALFSKGALRTMETLERFKKFSKPIVGQKLPLLIYCEALMQSSPAYKPVSIQEAVECTKCALSQGKYCTRICLHSMYVCIYTHIYIRSAKHDFSMDFTRMGNIMHEHIKLVYVNMFYSQLPSYFEVAVEIFYFCSCQSRLMLVLSTIVMNKIIFIQGRS